MTPRPSEVTRQAADWVIRLRSPDLTADCEARFAQWLCASPLHVREYLAAVEVWQCLADPCMKNGRSRDELINEASTTGLVDFPSRAQPPTPLAERPASRWVWGAALAAAVLLSLFYMGWRNSGTVQI